MNKNKSLNIVVLIAILSGLAFVSCAQPNPLTGTWADNRGDQLTLQADYNYIAKIRNKDGDLNTYDGSFNVLLNAISFTSESGYQVVSEWDIRGNMLYLTWPDSKGTPLVLTLYKTKN